MPYAPMIHEQDPKNRILEQFGEFPKIELLGNNLLVAVYIRPQKTQSAMTLVTKAKPNPRSSIGAYAMRNPVITSSE